MHKLDSLGIFIQTVYTQAYTLNSCLSPNGRSYETPFVAAGIYGGIRSKMPRRFSNIAANNRIPLKVRLLLLLLLCYNAALALDKISHYPCIVKGKGKITPTGHSFAAIL